MPTNPATVEVLTFPKMCCGRPTQTKEGKPHCPIHAEVPRMPSNLRHPDVIVWKGGY